MKRFLIAALAALSLLAVGGASAAMDPGVYDPDNTGCVTATYSKGVLHLAKNCPTSTNAAAGADIFGLEGQMFQSASFTLASASQCQGGSPRFDVVTTGGLFFLGCNNVTPTANANGTATYTFAASNLIPADPTKTVPGTITGLSILIDVQGTADVTKIFVNGVLQKPVNATQKCKNGGWKALHFKNQGQCVSHFAHLAHHG
jgi:hypothetical protein